MTVTTPRTETSDAIDRRVERADAVGTMYAYGRMDQGHPPVLGLNDSGPNPTDSAWTFGRMYGEQERAFSEGTQGYAYGLATAWDHFVANEGKSLDQPSRYQASLAATTTKED